ncbi:methionyl-tRNA formyltransferase [Kocuria coralli]|uniref:Methionyl-tRNA formyltransferase n=1 Tax=Kocuria coralli TaxID=1461025 RepID=A0A5J5KWV6_9MICC|nr:methionyl-tRNA formyltransferase [Kocuria coralli]KAA9393395.1 methionyl-tRNA formyltransferase [Kocuria coralli]
MKVLYAGTPDVAVAPLRHLAAAEDIDVVGVLTRTDAPVGRKKVLRPSPVAAAADELGLPVIKANRVDQETVERIRRTGAEAAAVVAYGALLKRDALDAVPLGWVNLHFSILPAWRGAAPVQRSLLAGEMTAGATTFVLEEGMDTGPVLRTFTEPVRDDDVAGTVLARLSDLGAPVLLDSLRDLVAGVQPRPQAGQASLASKLTGPDGRIDWGRPAPEIAARVRAVTPEPGAWTEMDGARFKITDRVAEHPGVTDLAPGAVTLRDKRVLVGTSTHAVELLQVQPAGKKTMAAGDWARGRLGADGTTGGAEFV